MPKVKPDLARLLSIVIIWYSILVMLGWIFDVRVFFRPFADLGGMAFTTAIMFLAAGLAALSIRQITENKIDRAQVILPATTIIILLVLVARFASNLFRVRIGIESIITNDPSGFIARITLPPFAVILAFLFFSFVSLGALYGAGKRFALLARNLGLVIILLGVSAVIGYTIGASWLYWRVSSVFSILSPNTAFLLSLLGATTFILGNKLSEIKK